MLGARGPINKNHSPLLPALELQRAQQLGQQRMGIQRWHHDEERRCHH